VRSEANSGLARRAPATVTPPVVRAAMQRWAATGAAPSTIALQVRTLRAAFGWAFEERLLAGHPLLGMRGPAQPEPRRDAPPEVVRELLVAADDDVLTALTTPDGRTPRPAGPAGHGYGDVTLHRLRHTVATVLVANGQLLHTQQRLGHRDASTTLRQYCHALPLEDPDVPDTLDAAYHARAIGPR